MWQWSCAQKALLILIYLVLAKVESAKILVYCPSIGKSHILLCSKYADLLQKNEHNVTLFIPTYNSKLDNYNGAKYAKVWRLTDIDGSFEQAFSVSQWTKVLASSSLGFYNKVYFDHARFAPMCDAILRQRHRLEPLRAEKFDLAIAEDIDYCNFGVLRFLGIHNIALLSSEPLLDHIAYNFGIPSPLSYVPSIEENALSDRMTFVERAQNAFRYTASKFIHHLITRTMQSSFYRHISPDFPSIVEIARNSSICFVNTNEMFDLSRPISHKTVYVGLLPEQENTLDERTEKVMNRKSKGVVLISFGTVAPFHLMPAHIRLAVHNVIKSFPDFVFLLKLTPGDATTKDLFHDVGNVDFSYWLPQLSVLKHPNMKLFVSHGGMNSVLEGMSCGVPMIVVPVFTDQFRNAKNVERRNAGIMISRQDVNNQTLLDSTKRILLQDSYMKSAKRVSKLMNSRPFTAEKRVVQWINFALKYYPFENFDLQATKMSFVQYFHLDLIFVTIIACVVASCFLPYFWRKEVQNPVSVQKWRFITFKKNA